MASAMKRPKAPGLWLAFRQRQTHAVLIAHLQVHGGDTLRWDVFVLNQRQQGIWSDKLTNFVSERGEKPGFLFKTWDYKRSWMEQIGIITYYNMILLATIIRRYLPVNIRHTKKKQRRWWIFKIVCECLLGGSHQKYLRKHGIWCGYMIAIWFWLSVIYPHNYHHVTIILPSYYHDISIISYIIYHISIITLFDWFVMSILLLDRYMDE